MRIALIAPPYPLSEAPSPPLGISYVAATCIETGAEVAVFDYIVSRYTPEKLHRDIDSFQPEVVPPGYPPIFEMLPDLDSFYREWLGQPLPDESPDWFADKTLEKPAEWAREG